MSGRLLYASDASDGCVAGSNCSAGSRCGTSEGWDGVSESVVVASDRTGRTRGQSATWPRAYVRQVVVADFSVAVMAAGVAFGLRFGAQANGKYLALSLLLPALWMIALRLVGGYEMRFLGTGSDEFRKVLNAGVGLTGALALISYAANNGLSRIYLVISRPAIVLLDLLVRFALRKRLHHRRAVGLCMSTVIAVGHEAAVANLINELRREPYHGLEVIGACLPDGSAVNEVAGVPTLLHVDHPQLSGPRQVLKDLFDRSAGTLALIVLSPLMLAVDAAIKLSDAGPALFTQTRVGKDGQVFKIYKFRTMVVDAEKRLVELQAKNEFDGVLFKMRRDPRITAVGARLRKWSLDELPQLFNVLLGEMSLVGPRPALPDEAALYADHVRRRLVVKPGLTGLWQVSGRSDLTWDESVRLDLRYVENWSLALDLQILWKTSSVIFRGSGAY